jgi:hypothetical protein
MAPKSGAFFLDDEQRGCTLYLFETPRFVPSPNPPLGGEETPMVIAIAIAAYVVVALVVARACSINSRLERTVDNIPMPTTPERPEDTHHSPHAA